MIEIECLFNPPHSHTYEDDWEFGGPMGNDPRADTRWKSRSYEYYDASFQKVITLGTFRCDDEALDAFTQVAKLGFAPVYVGVRVSPNRGYAMLQYQYDEAEDTVYPL